MNEHDQGLPIEQFIQALTMQLDRAQSAMALKARALELPLTFAVKDISLDLRAHLEMVRGEVRVVPAGPGDREASVIRMAFTTITKPMIEENTLDVATESDDVPLRDALGRDFTEEEQNRLEWAGLRTVSQLRQLEEQAGEDALRRVVQLPVDRLRAALNRASQPFVRRVIKDRLQPVQGGLHQGREEAGVGRRFEAESSGNGTVDPGGTRRNLLRIRGRNLIRDGLPTIRIGSNRLAVVDANDREIVVDAGAAPMAGILAVETGPGYATEFALAPDRMDELDYVEPVE